ncbi:MAG: hypothetical protein II153_06135 [Erysipelotrichaceae bacterium]|nr:hypothetical protein [Erysipelotrichaceae bacterium]
MPKRRIIKASDLSGIFIYQDPKKGAIFYDVLSRKGYILTSSDVSTYTLYTAMLPLCIVMALLCVQLFHLNYLAAAIIFIALYLIAAMWFRFTFFYKLPVAERWKPVKKENLFVYMARGYTKQRLIVLILLLLALTILMPVYAAEEHFEGVNLYATYVVAAATFVGLIITTTSLIIKNKHNY